MHVIRTHHVFCCVREDVKGKESQTKEVVVQTAMYIIKVIKYLITILDQCIVHNKLGWILPIVSRLVK